MPAPKRYPTRSARVEARRLSWRTSKAKRRLSSCLVVVAAPTEAPTMPFEPLSPPVDAVVSLFDAAARRVAKNTFDTQIEAAKAKLAAERGVNPMHFLRENLYQLATAMRADFMGEAEVLLKRCL
jgi:hypothetical protein